MSILFKAGRILGERTGIRIRDSQPINELCKFCKAEMRPGSTHCHECGKRNNMGGYGFALVAAMLLMLFVGMCRQV